ncbi:MAG: signal peptidase I [Chloroflexota bacterium]
MKIFLLLLSASFTCLAVACVPAGKPLRQPPNVPIISRTAATIPPTATAAVTFGSAKTSVVATPEPMATIIPPTPATTPTPQPVWNGWMADYRPTWMGFILYGEHQQGTRIIVTATGQSTTSVADISCCKLGEPLTQSYVNSDGTVSVFTFKPATQIEWNQALTAWQEQLAQQRCSFIEAGTSMDPTLTDGQLLIVLTHERAPNRGDVVLFRYPLNPSQNFVKRVIGLPGDTIEVRNHQVVLDGKVLKEPYIKAASNGFYPRTVVPRDDYFVMGDNRNNSSDSRSWGPLPQKDIIGTVAPSPTGGLSSPPSPPCLADP